MYTSQVKTDDGQHSRCHAIVQFFSRPGCYKLDLECIYAADGPQGFRQFIAFLRDKYPYSHSGIVKSFADGDHVILHVHAVREPGTRGNAIIDIFKLEKGNIVEHWDVTQAIPEKTASGNPMF